ncbi:MAG: Slp family lipoprotein [Xanthomonadales bacterium]|nr:Slp family lipoprotein [Xanthomonadales bacterium]
MKSTLILVVGASALASACISVPQPLAGEWPALSARGAGPGDLGQRVRWGGEVVEARPGEPHSCVVVLQRPLDDGARPDWRAPAGGRFLACKQGHLDPDSFRPGTPLTVTGTLAQFESLPVGDFEYRMPLVETDFIALW